jgi:BirA family biotin operon repressor/biotin-[acetyl-CoA-carboxylase] ligase
MTPNGHSSDAASTAGREPRQEPEAAPEITEDTLLPLLQTAVLGRRLHALGKCDSTNGFARRLLENLTAGRPGPPNGTLVVAEHQRVGRGRGSRTWHSPPGVSLLLSLILYPTQNATRAEASHVPDTPQLVTMAVALALVRVLERAGAADCSIKWPNDILGPDGRKLSGILTETVVSPSGTTPLIAGVGINVNQMPEDFPEALRPHATSVREILRKVVSRLELLADFLLETEQCLSLDDESLFRDWERRNSTLGRMVRLRTGDRTLVGHAQGIDTDGSLLLRVESGVTLNVRSGDVSEVRGVEGP